MSKNLFELTAERKNLDKCPFCCELYSMLDFCTDGICVKSLLTVCLLGNFAIFIVVCRFFSKYNLKKNLSGIPSEC